LNGLTAPDSSAIAGISLDEACATLAGEVSTFEPRMAIRQLPPASAPSMNWYEPSALILHSPKKFSTASGSHPCAATRKCKHWDESISTLTGDELEWVHILPDRCAAFLWPIESSPS
jgi:hypothetical protein